MAIPVVLIKKKKRTLPTDLERKASVLMSRKFQCKSEARFFTIFVVVHPWSRNLSGQ